MSDGVKKAVLGVIALTLVCYAIYSFKNNVGEAEIPANTRVLMDSETGALFNVRMEDLHGGYPQTNPKTGKKTLYPTEVCYANKCGEKGGTRVILNHWLGKEEPTYCPKCGALVKFHNPRTP